MSDRTLTGEPAGPGDHLRLRTTVLAALAVVLTGSALRAVYADSGWLLSALGAVVAVTAGALAARALRAPALAQPLIALMAAAGYAVLLYARGTLAFGLVPTTSTARRLGELVGQGLLDIEQRAAPVPSTPGLVLLTVLGLAAVAAAVDLAAVTLRRPAVAGLPLLALVTVPAGTLPDGVGWLPFVLAAGGWLALLLDDASGRTTRWGVALRSRSPGPPGNSLGSAGRRIGVASVGLALAVSALVPGLDSRVFASGSGDGVGGARTTVTYNPLTELAGQLRLPTPRTLLVYSSTDPSPDYLRMTTLDRFSDTSGWSSSELSADVRRDAVSRGLPPPPAVSGAQPVTTSVRMQALGGPWLPIPARPTGVDVPGPWLWDRRSETVFSTRTRVEQLRAPYRVTSSRVTPDPAALRGSSTSGPGTAPYAQPPQVSPYVRDLTRQVTSAASTDYDKVIALQAFLRDPANGFVYSEDATVPPTGTRNALEAFLRQRRGFCEQYSSAMAAMVRLLGIPARVAVGFTQGTRTADGSWRVTTSNAHAWPEVWFPQTGWLRFEPTPRGSQVDVPSYTVLPAPGGGSDTPAATPSAAPPTAAAPDPAGAGPAGRPDPGGGSATGTPAGGGTSRTPVLAGGALVLLLAAPSGTAVLRRRRLWRAGGAEAAWAHVVEDATDVGHRWRPSQSPRAAADRLVQERGLEVAAAGALHRLAAQVQLARYGRPAAAGDIPEEQLRRDVHAVRAGLLASVPPGRRWLARLLPPSALRWAATSSATAVADTLDRLDELASRAGARLGRRPA